MKELDWKILKEDDNCGDSITPGGKLSNILLGILGVIVLIVGSRNMHYLRKKKRFSRNKHLFILYGASQATVIGKLYLCLCTATIVFSLDVFIQFSCCAWNIFRFIPCFGFQIVGDIYALHW